MEGTTTSGRSNLCPQIEDLGNHGWADCWLVLPSPICTNMFQKLVNQLTVIKEVWSDVASQYFSVPCCKAESQMTLSQPICSWRWSNHEGGCWRRSQMEGWGQWSDVSPCHSWRNQGRNTYQDRRRVQNRGKWNGDQEVCLKSYHCGLKATCIDAEDWRDKGRKGVLAKVGRRWNSRSCCGGTLQKTCAST